MHADFYIIDVKLFEHWVVIVIDLTIVLITLKCILKHKIKPENADMCAYTDKGYVVLQHM